MSALPAGGNCVANVNLDYMAKGFTEKETIAIRAKLKEAAQKCASSIGMRKTTVDDLCDHANISKGAYYDDVT